jgi:hypothetical protein
MDDLFENLFGDLHDPASQSSSDPPITVITAPTNPQQIVALARIEAVLEGTVDAIINNDKQLSITLKRRKTREQLRRGPESALSPSVSEATVTFPGKTPQEAWQFSQHRQPGRP